MNESVEQEKVVVDKALWEEFDLETLDERVEFYADPGGGYCSSCWVHYM